MFRLFFYILVIAGFSYGLSLVADMEGKLIIQWPGGEIQPTIMQAVLVFIALLILVMFLWTLFRMVMSSPEAFSRYLSIKKKKKGVEALSSGLIALGAGDDIQAQRYAMQAKKTLPNDPMTLILRAQAAELKGDVQQATKLYESMLATSDTEVFGLRGLYMLALQQNEIEAATQYAARAVQRRPDLSWAVIGLFDLQCKSRLWRAALETLKIATDKKHVPSKLAKRQRAVLLTALALELEDSHMDEALNFASEASKLAPSLIPASVVAGRIHASKGHMGPALKVLRKCWKLAPHPDLAVVSAFARPGDSVRDRLERIKSLAKLTPGHKEAVLAVASAAVEAQDWATAREALGPLLRGRPTQRACTLMARIEAADGGDTGQVREWLARGIQAMPDPQWVADGVVADEWAPLSPISQKLDGFEWKVPPEDDVISEDTHTLKKLLAGLVTAEGLTASNTLESTSEGADGRDDDLVDLKLVPLEDELEVADMKTVRTAEVVDVAPVVETAKGVKKYNTSEKSQDVNDQEPDDFDTDVDLDRENSEVVAATEVKETEQEVAPVAKVSVKPTEDEVMTSKPKSKRKRRKRTKIYVAPPAPDDPGTDEFDDIEVGNRVRPVRF